VFFLFLIVLFVLELKHYRRITNTSWWLSIAIVLGFAIGYIFGKKYSIHAKDLTERIQIYMFCIVTALVFSPMLVSLTNRFLPQLKTEIVVAELAKEQKIVAERFGTLKGAKPKEFKYKSHLFVNASALTFVTNEPNFSNYLPGDHVKILNQ